MRIIEFVNGVSNELVKVMNQNAINAICVCGNICYISDDDFERLHEVAEAAFDGNDIIYTDESKEIIYKGYRVDVCEDDENWYVNFNTGFGVGIYSKEDFSLEAALENQLNA